MRPLNTLLVALVAVLVSTALVLADDSCSGEDTMNMCLTQSEEVLDSCGNNDICLCTQYKVQAACYDWCPNSANATGLQNLTMAQATARCNGTDNSTRAGPIADVNVSLTSQTVLPGQPSAFGNASSEGATKRSAAAGKHASQVALSALVGASAIAWVI